MKRSIRLPLPYVYAYPWLLSGGGFYLKGCYWKVVAIRRGVIRRWLLFGGVLLGGGCYSIGCYCEGALYKVVKGTHKPCLNTVHLGVIAYKASQDYSVAESLIGWRVCSFVK